MSPDHHQARGSAQFRLLDLPPELIQEVCECLCWHCHERGRWSVYSPDSAALRNLCITSKAMYQIATPVFYHEFGYVSNKLEKLALFLRTLCERPGLGQYVVDLDLGAFYWYKLPADLVRLFNETAAHRLGIDLAALGNWSAESPLETMSQMIIALCPNVRRVHFEVRAVYCSEGEGEFAMLAQIAAQAQPRVRLNRLRKFSFEHDDSGRDIRLENFAGLFRLAPNLNVLHTGDCFGAKFPLSLENIVDLSLKDGQLTRQAFEAIVTSCTALNSFFYRTGGCASCDGEEISPREAVEILAMRHARSLRSLELDCGRRYRPVSSEEWGYTGLCPQGQQILDLRDFTALETLKVEGSSLLFPYSATSISRGYTDMLLAMLPRSLRVFHLEDAQPEALPHVDALAENLHAFPHLREVLLTANRAQGPLSDIELHFNRHELRVAREKYERAGVIWLESDQSDDD